MNPVSKLLSAVVLDFYSIKSIQVDITRAAESRENDLIQSGIINDVLYDVNAKIPVRLENHETPRGSYPRAYNIFVIDSYNSFRYAKSFHSSAVLSSVLWFQKNH